MKKIAFIAVPLLSFFTGNAQPLTQTEVCKRFSPAVVQIQTGRPSYGTGFIVSEDGWILTAAHVVIDEKTRTPDSTITVILSSGQTLFAALVPNPDRMSRSQDFALLKVDSAKLPILDIGEENVVVPGESLAFIGFPFSAIGANRNKFCLFAIAATAPISVGGQNVIYFQGPSVKGVSGSPLISLKTGKVVGIVVIKLTGIGPGLDEARENIKALGEVLTVSGPEGRGIGVTSTMGDIIDTLDNQLANDLGAALGTNDAEYAFKKAQRQNKNPVQSK